MQNHLLIQAMKNIPDGFTISDAAPPDFPHVYVNKSFTQITGYSGEECVGRNCRLLQGPKTDSATAANIRDALLAGEPFAGEILNYRRDGTEFWNLLRLAPIRDEAGVVTHFIGMQTDISESKNQELDNQQLRDSLAHLDHVAAVASLSASIGHEISQPLAAIRFNSQAALNFIESGNTAEVKASLLDTIDAANRTAKIVDRMRDLVQLKVPAQNPVDMNKVVAECLSLQSAELASRDIEVQLNLVDNLPVVFGSHEQCLQVMNNLVQNAAAAIVSAPSESQLIKIETLVTTGAVEVRIEDSGCGADEKTISQMFEALFTTKDSGSGFGLLVCRAIIEAHEGAIIASGNANSGLTVRFTLPTA